MEIKPPPIIKAYKILMSKGEPIKIDEEELKKVIQGIQTGRPVVVKQGIFNPSFYISIYEDTSRVKEIERENYHILEDAKRFQTKPEYKNLRPLKNIFQDLKLLNGKTKNN